MRAIPTLGSPITMGQRGQTWLSFVVFDTFNVLNILSYPVSTMGPTMVGPGEKFSNNGSQVAGKRYHEIDFCNTISHKRAVLSGTP